MQISQGSNFKAQKSMIYRKNAKIWCVSFVFFFREYGEHGQINFRNQNIKSWMEILLPLRLMLFFRYNSKYVCNFNYICTNVFTSSFFVSSMQRRHGNYESRNYGHGLYDPEKKIFINILSRFWGIFSKLP